MVVPKLDPNAEGGEGWVGGEWGAVHRLGGLRVTQLGCRIISRT